jgi:8-oxo-dGTP pyrophosphatase MutT (NUDIX family)
MDQDYPRFDIDLVKNILECERNKAKRENSNFSYKGLRKAAVLIPFVCVNGELSLLFTRRADNLKNHQGQVSFPGGGMEENDSSIIDTAYREAYEEIGLSKSDINYIGLMPEFVTISEYIVTPIVSWINWPLKLNISNDEVSRVFTIPIHFLKDKNNWEERIYTHPSGWYGSVIFYNLYDGELLWGISAKITIDLLRMLGEVIR